MIILYYERKVNMSVLTIILGILMIIGGIVCLCTPVATTFGLMYFYMILFFVSGIILLIRSIAPRRFHGILSLCIVHYRDRADLYFRGLVDRLGYRKPRRRDQDKKVSRRRIVRARLNYVYPDDFDGYLFIYSSGILCGILRSSRKHFLHLCWNGYPSLRLLLNQKKSLKTKNEHLSRLTRAGFCYADFSAF